MDVAFMRNIYAILIVLFLFIAGCAQATPPSSQPEPAQSTTPSSSQPIQPSTPASSPIIPTPAEPSPPPIIENPTSYEYERYTNSKYGFSIRYPKTWSSWKPPLDTNVFMASATPLQPDRLAVCIDIRPATNFKAAARDLMYELVRWKTEFAPPVEAFYIISENTAQLADGKTTTYDMCWAIANYRVYFYGILKDGKAIIVASGWDEDQSDLYKEIIHTLTFK